MSWTEQIDTFRTTTSAPSTVSNHGFKWLGVRKEVGSDPTSTGTEINLKRKLKQKERKVPAQDPISTKNCLKREEVGSDQTSTGTEIKLENVSEKKVKQEERDKFRWGLAADPKYLVREMKPLTWPLQAPRTSLRPTLQHALQNRLGVGRTRCKTMARRMRNSKNETGNLRRRVRCQVVMA